jgi:alpha/beta superfamily hydrolase
MSRFEIDPTHLAPETPVRFPGPVGDLEGLWRPVRPDRKLRGVLVVAHPLPTQGGTMMNKVVFHTTRVLHHDLDLASLRFNFRGTGASAGVYDRGRGEPDDVRAAWREARRRIQAGALVAAGFSFGAAMTLHAVLRAAADEESLPDALAVLGLPVDRFPLPSPFPVPVPIAAVHGEQDIFTPPEGVGKFLESWPGPNAFRVEPGADHFLEGSLVSAIRFLSRTLSTWL